MTKAKIEEGTKVIDFCLPESEDSQVCINDLKGSWVVLYFYPKDNTSGCTKEAIAFSELLPEFEKLGATVIGISKDSIKSHKRFAEKHNLKVRLLSDEDHKVIEAFGAWKKKSMYGRQYWGTERSTFLIDPEGTVVKIWRKVKVAGHVEEVLNTLKELASK